MSDQPESVPSFAQASLAAEDERRRADSFARPARTKFRWHAILFVVANVVLAIANRIFLPEHRVFFYLTIVWGFILLDNFIWAYVVDPDRDVHERELLREERARRRGTGESERGESHGHVG